MANHSDFWQLSEVLKNRPTRLNGPEFKQWATNLNDLIFSQSPHRLPEGIGVSDVISRRDQVSEINKENSTKPRFSLEGGGTLKGFSSAPGSIFGGEIKAEAEFPFGRNGQQLRFNLGTEHLLGNGAGWRENSHRIQGAGGTLVNPSGSEVSVQWHDKKNPVRDTLPAALPYELGITTPPSRGWLLNWRKPF